MGQTSTVFFQNASLFFLGRETCGGKTGPWSIIDMRYGGPIGNMGGLESTFNNLAADMKANGNVPTLQMVWDWTCNIIVAGKEYADPTQLDTFTVKDVEISEYDARNRPMATLESASPPSVPTRGAAVALPARGHEPPPDNKDEWHCAGCVLYSVEKYLHPVAGDPLYVLVGRDIRTGKIYSHVHDSLWIQTMTYVPQLRIDDTHNSRPWFLGIGKCAQARWAPEQCNGKPVGSLFVVKWSYIKVNGVPNGIVSHIVKFLPIDEITIKMGVAINLPTDMIAKPQVLTYSIWSENVIWTFNLNLAGAKDDVVSKSDPVSGVTPSLWGYTWPR